MTDSFFFLSNQPGSRPRPFLSTGDLPFPRRRNRCDRTPPHDRPFFFARCDLLSSSKGTLFQKSLVPEGRSGADLFPLPPELKSAHSLSYAGRFLPLFLSGEVAALKIRPPLLRRERPHPFLSFQEQPRKVPSSPLLEHRRRRFSVPLLFPRVFYVLDSSERDRLQLMLPRQRPFLVPRLGERVFFKKEKSPSFFTSGWFLLRDLGPWHSSGRLRSPPSFRGRIQTPPPSISSPSPLSSRKYIEATCAPSQVSRTRVF